MSTKICHLCQIDKELDEFPKDGRNRDGRAGRCKKCNDIRVRAWQKKNNARVLAASRRWKDRNKEHVRAYTRKWNAENRERHNANVKAWFDAHPGAGVFYKRRRENRKRQAGGTHSREDLKARIEYYGGRCWICGCDWYALPKGEQTIDHVKPIAKGGSDWPSNLRPACKSCNSAKSGTWPYQVSLGLILTSPTL